MFSEVLFAGVDSVRHLSGKRNTAVISILDYSERQSRPDLTEFAAILTLEFEDVSDGAPVLFGKTLPDDAPIGQDRCPHNIEERFCTLRDANLVLDFIEKIKGDPRIKTLFIHCYAGQSRSAAVARFVLDVYGDEVKDCGLRLTGGKNQRFYRLLHMAASNRGFSIEADTLSL